MESDVQAQATVQSGTARNGALRQPTQATRRHILRVGNYGSAHELELFTVCNRSRSASNALC
jgi:hypothetical protein